MRRGKTRRNERKALLEGKTRRKKGCGGRGRTREKKKDLSESENTKMGRDCCQG